MVREPLRYNVPITRDGGFPTEYFQRLWALLPTGGTGSTVSITFGTDFSASPNPITGTGSVALSATGVVPGSYTLANVTVDSKGRITSVSNGSAAASGAIGSSGLTMATARLLGRTAAGTGAIQEITVGTGLSLSGTNLAFLPEIRSAGQVVISTNTTIGAGTIGAHILIATVGITITFPASGIASGQGVLISNLSGGNVTLSAPGGSDFGATLPNNGSFFAFCDGGGFWRQFCYSTSRL